MGQGVIHFERCYFNGDIRGTGREDRICRFVDTAHHTFFFGVDYRWVVPCSAILGGIFLRGATF